MSYKLLLLGIFFTGFIILSPSQAQKLTSVIDDGESVTKSQNPKGQVTPLSNILFEMEAKYDVSFNFNSEIIEDKNIDLEKLDQIEKDRLDQSLKEMFTPLNLGFEKLSPGHYVIFEEKESLKNKDHNLKKLESRSPVKPEINSNQSRGEVNNFQIASLGASKIVLDAKKQATNVRGTVTSSDGEALPGVNVVEQGTSNGTVTNANGDYSLQVPSDAALVFSFVGYEENVVQVNGRQEINITMQEAATQLEEVVTIGYRERERGALTGSVGEATGTEIVESNTPNLQESLQGRIPGLKVSDRGGPPGDPNLDFLVRGKATFGNNSPLIVIDGVPRQNFAHLSPNDVESVTVLKDASAAIYGARAANGVILVQTKEGRAGESSFSFQTEYGIQKPTSIFDMMNSYQRAQYNYEGANYEGTDPFWSQDAIEHFRTGDQPLQYPNTDWYDVVAADYAPQTHHNLSARGGSEDIQYYVSGDYLYQGGLLKSGDLNYKQYQLRSNIKFQAADNLELGINISGRLEKRKEPQATSPFVGFSTYPWIVDRWANGKLGPPTESMQNPITQTTREYGYEDQNDRILNAKIDFSYQMPYITEGLELSGYANYTRRNGDERTFYNTWTMYSRDPNTGELTPQPAFSRSHRGSRGVYSNMSLFNKDFYNIQLSYDQSFDQHNVSGFVAYEQIETYDQFLQGYRKGLPSASQPYLWAGQEQERDNYESIFEGGRVNYFGSVSYNFDRKYMVDFTLRNDGSFNFAEGNRFGLFPSVSGGWAISEESFMNGLGWMDNLKLRASYGKMGNDAVPDFQYLAQYDYENSFAFGLSPHMEKGFDLENAPNPGITWEISRQQNYGFDLTALEGLFTFTMDYFYEKRRQILLSRGAEVPNYTALDLPDENFGKVDNQGVELQLTHKNTSTGPLNYNVSGNFMYSKNEIIDMAEPEGTPEWRKQEGHSLDSWVVYKSNGIYNNQQEIDNSVSLDGSIPGDINYQDVDGDGEISGNDQVRKYTSLIPEIQFGVNGGVEYQGLELNLFLQGQANATSQFFFGDQHYYAELFKKRWTPENQDAEYPRAFLRDDFHNRRESEFWLRDATFLRIKNVTLAYNLPSQWVSNVGISNFRVYLRGRNLKTWDKMIGNYDPEKEGGVSPYPQIMRLTAGANISF